MKSNSALALALLAMTPAAAIAEPAPTHQAQQLRVDATDRTDLEPGAVVFVDRLSNGVEVQTIATLREVGFNPYATGMTVNDAGTSYSLAGLFRQTTYDVTVEVYAGEVMASSREYHVQLTGTLDDLHRAITGDTLAALGAVRV